MKAFKPLTVAQQRDKYPQMLHRSFTCTKARIAIDHNVARGKADKLEERISGLYDTIERIENRVANKADRKYGWRRWRQNKKLLIRVAREMMDATHATHVEIDACRARQRALRQPFVDEIDELNELQQKLLREAGCHWPYSANLAV